MTRLKAINTMVDGIQRHPASTLNHFPYPLPKAVKFAANSRRISTGTRYGVHRKSHEHQPPSVDMYRDRTNERPDGPKNRLF
jgi:hypothetical protein